MATSSTPLPAESPDLPLPSLPDHLRDDKGFFSSYARTLAAIATHDKTVSLADFAALTEVARHSQYPALMAMLIFHALEQGIAFEQALPDLVKAAATCSGQECGAAFAMAQPFLQGQGPQARALARRLAQALNISDSAAALSALPPESETGLMQQLGSKARQLVKGKDVSDRVLEFARSIGDGEMMRDAHACRSGALSRELLGSRFAAVVSRIEHDIADYRATHAQVTGAGESGGKQGSQHGHQKDNKLANQHGSQYGHDHGHHRGHPHGERDSAGIERIAQELRQQIMQRLAIVSARIRHERQIFREDIDDLVHDAGNAIENAITGRLQSDQWQDKDVWASIAKTGFGQEAERRIGRAVQRREEVLRLFKEELKLFQSDMQVVQASILAKQHHAELAQLMPPLRLGTRMVNAIDAAANLTLGAGTIAVAGTGAAAYLLGSAVVLPFVAPAAPFLVGALAAAGLFKWFTDGDKRKIAEIQSKRRAIEEVVRRRLDEAAASFDSQLAQVEREYQQTALALLGPVLLDAEAARQVQAAHHRIASRIIEQSEAAMRRLSHELA